MAGSSVALGVAAAIDGDASPATLADGVEGDAIGPDTGATDGGALGALPPVEQATIDPAASTIATIITVRRASITIDESSPW
jgi:hypothetical protein